MRYPMSCPVPVHILFLWSKYHCSHYHAHYLFIYTVIYQLKVQIYTCHHRSSRHRVSGIDFVTLCQQVFSACPDVEPWGGTELSAQIP